MQVWFRRYARYLSVAVLLLASVACGPSPAKLPSPQVSPYADVQFELVDDLCERLDPALLIALAGSEVTTKTYPHRPDRDQRRCSIATTTPERTSLASAQIDTILWSSDGEGEGKLPSTSPWNPISGVGDSAVFQYFANEELLDPPPPFTARVRSLNATLMATAGNATISVRLDLYADMEFDRAEIEELLAEYAREALELMRV